MYFLLYNALFLQPAHKELHQRRRQDAQQEVEAVDDGFHARQQQAKNVHEQVSQQICQRDEGYLDGQLVDALLHGYLVVGLYLLGAQGIFLDLHELYLSPALLDI